VNRTAPQIPELPTALRTLYAPIADELAEAEAILRRELASDQPGVAEVVQHALCQRGKRLRPALLLLAGKACGALTRSHLVLAAVVEMIHTATLVHDDVLDQAALRRHLPTVAARWNNTTSILAGDYLFTHAFYLASTLDSTHACQVIGKATNRVCEGELRQAHERGNFRLGETEYLHIISGKTAELCACCGELGAYYAGASPGVVEAVARYGRFLGIAFQLADDLLDLVGEEGQMGKSLGMDLAQQKLTLPLIRLLDTAGPQERPDLIAFIRQADRTALVARLQQAGALQYVHERAIQFAALAKQALGVVPPGPARDVLAELAGLAVERTQ
jgi:octaprenyl-diphosphate synthase